MTWPRLIDRQASISGTFTWRAAPGQGHIDFVPILRALKEMDYQGYVAFELLPASGDPFASLEKGEGKEFFDRYTEQAIQVIKKIEQRLA